MPIRFSLKPSDLGFLIIHPNYLKTLFNRQTPTLFSSNMFAGFAEGQEKHGELVRPMFQDIEEALLWQILHSKDTALRDGVYVFEMKVDPAQATMHAQHYQIQLPHDRLEATKSLLKPSGSHDTSELSQTIANRLHRTCTFAIQPVTPSQLVPTSPVQVKQWTLQGGLASVTLPVKQPENVVQRDKVLSLKI